MFSEQLYGKKRTMLNNMGGFLMSSGFSDKLKATGNKLKGEVKEAIGNATDDPKLQAEGKADKLKSSAQEKFGEVKETISNKLNQ